MANDDLIRGGTASVTAGQATVTGQGVSWSNVREGDFFGAHVGIAAPIAAIAGPVITLAYNWPGPTQVAAAYAIQPKGDVTRFQDRVRLLVESLTNGTLAALTAAGSGVNKLAYYSGVGVAALTDLSPFARTNVLNKVDRAALLAGIGVSPNANFVPVLSTDLNTATNAGWYAGYTGLTANLPIADQLYIFTLPWTDGVACTQTACLAYGSPRRQWSRDRNAALVWSAWTEQKQQSFTSIEQAGYAGQAAGTKINIGWDSATGGLRAAAGGNQDLGKIWTDYSSASNAVGASGYQKLPSGIIFQWGYVSSGNTITYPLVFPATSMSLVATPFSLSNTTSMFSVGIATNSNSGATVTRLYVSPGPAGPAPSGESFAWMAMGR